MNFNHMLQENIEKTNLNIYYEQQYYEYNDSIITENKNYLLEGYFQNKKYTGESPFPIIGMNELLTEYPLLQTSYFIHVRRGDYVSAQFSKFYSFDSNDYYKKAIEYILEKEKDAHFYILSDDTEYIKTYSIFQGINKIVVEGKNTLDSLYIMALCDKGGICANSTFSGWGAKLNRNDNKIVICPKQWVNFDIEYEIPFEYTIAF
jgi:hypothetical protein